MLNKASSDSSDSRRKASEKFLEQKRKPIDLGALLKGIATQDRLLLSQAITLVESEHPNDRATALQLFDQLPKSDHKAYRIGVTGPPGAGKSTFIETFGTQLLNQGSTIAVLTVDPSSQRNRGSILGDKTRMELLGKQAKAYIRPSAAGNSLGGIHARSRESIAILEAAGFDYILVETVGVGQSEVAVQEIVDCLLLLLTPAGGDELQGIKRGVVEMADLLLVNKSDGDLQIAAKHTRKAYANALHLFPVSASGWIPKVLTVSALENKGMEELKEAIINFRRQSMASGAWAARRAQQSQDWFEQSLDGLMRTFLIENTQALQKFEDFKVEVKAGNVNPLLAANQLFSNWRETI